MNEDFFQNISSTGNPIEYADTVQRYQTQLPLGISWPTVTGSLNPSDLYTDDTSLYMYYPSGVNKTAIAIQQRDRYGGITFTLISGSANLYIQASEYFADPNPAFISSPYTVSGEGDTNLISASYLSDTPENPQSYWINLPNPGTYKVVFPNPVISTAFNVTHSGSSPYVFSQMLPRKSVGSYDIDVNSIRAYHVTASFIDAVAIQVSDSIVVGPDLIGAKSIDGSKIIDGTISGVLIRDGTVTGNKVLAGTISGVLLQGSTITGDKIVANTISGSLIAANTITASKIAAGTITFNEIASGTLTADQIADGAVTGRKILDGTISGVLITNDAISASKIQANAITASKIAAGTITSNEIAVSGITAINMAANSITADNISVRTITAEKIVLSGITAELLGAEAVTAAALASGAVISGKIAADSIYASNIVGGQITGYHVAANTITGDKIQANTISGALITAGTITFDKIASNTLTSGQIANGTITGQNILAGTVSGVLITNNSITATNIAGATITGDKIVARTISGSLITAGTIKGENIEAATISGSLIAANAITAGKIAAGTITFNEIASNTLTSGQIANGTITGQKIVDGTISGVLISNGTITGSKVQARTISGALITAGTIRGENIEALTISGALITAGTITATNIAVSGITADRLNVTQLDAVAANMGTLVVNSGISIGANGTIWAGTGTVDSPTTGLKIYTTSGISRLTTYSGSVAQIDIGSDGKLLAGAGAVVLDSSGLTADKVKLDSAGLTIGNTSSLLAVSDALRIQGSGSAGNIVGMAMYNGAFSAVNPQSVIQLDSTNALEIEQRAASGIINFNFPDTTATSTPAQLNVYNGSINMRRNPGGSSTYKPGGIYGWDGNVNKRFEVSADQILLNNATQDTVTISSSTGNITTIGNTETYDILALNQVTAYTSFNSSWVGSDYVFKINSAGKLTTTNMGYISARRTTDVAITTAGTTITWSNALRNNNITVSTDTITITNAGYYMFSATFATVANLTSLRMTLQRGAVNYVSTLHGAGLGTGVGYIFNFSVGFWATASSTYKIVLTPSANTTLIASAEGTAGPSPILHIFQSIGV